MAASIVGSSDLVRFRETPEHFGQIVHKMGTCYELYRRSNVPILSRQVRTKIDLCAANFHYLCTQTATIAERASSIWSNICIQDLEGDPSNVKRRVTQCAKEMSQKFTNISEKVRALCGQLHDCQKLADRDKNKYVEKVRQALSNAETAQSNAESARREAQEETNSAEDAADGWRVAAMIPIVNIVGLPGYLVAEDQAEKARCDLRIKEKTLADARAEVEVAEEELKDVKIAAEHLSDLIKLLEQVEEICVAQASFWRFQADKVGSLPSTFDVLKDFLELGIVDESTKQLFSQRSEEFLKYQAAMLEIDKNFTLQRPHEFLQSAFSELYLN